MTEIKKTLSILKARWPEVVLIIGLGILFLFVNKLILIVQPKVTPMQVLIDLGYLLLVWLILIMLIVGFQRTVYLEGDQRQSPMVLIRVGKHFFWRVVGLGLLFLIVCFILAWLIFLIIKQFTFIDAGFFQAYKVVPFIYQLCFVTAWLILMKPILFIPALIIVLDCRVFKSFKFLKLCKLLEAKELLVLFVVSMGLTFLWTLLPKLNDIETPLEYIFTIVLSISGHFIGLMISVMSVRFVASLNLEYDNQPVSLDFEDLQ